MKEDNIMIYNPEMFTVTILVYTLLIFLLCFYEKQTNEQQQNQVANKPLTLYKWFKYQEFGFCGKFIQHKSAVWRKALKGEATRKNSTPKRGEWALPQHFPCILTEGIKAKDRPTGGNAYSGDKFKHRWDTREHVIQPLWDIWRILTKECLRPVALERRNSCTNAAWSTSISHSC